MRTLGYCLDQGFHLYLGCATCRRRERAAQPCKAFRSFTVDELQRMRVIACPACGGPPRLSVVGLFWGLPSELESWGDDFSHCRGRNMPGYTGFAP